MNAFPITWTGQVFGWLHLKPLPFVVYVQDSHGGYGGGPGQVIKFIINVILVEFSLILIGGLACYPSVS